MLNTEFLLLFLPKCIQTCSQHLVCFSFSSRFCKLSLLHLRRYSSQDVGGSYEMMLWDDTGFHMMLEGTTGLHIMLGMLHYFRG